MGKPTAEVYIPNDTSQSEVGNPNTNIVVPFAAKNNNFYFSRLSNSTVTTTQQQKAKTIGLNVGAIAVAVIIILAIFGLFYLLLSKRSSK
jgi:hypothetical protein